MRNPISICRRNLEFATVLGVVVILALRNDAAVAQAAPVNGSTRHWINNDSVGDHYCNPLQKTGVRGEEGSRGAMQKAGKPRLLVLTDIGGDPDDQQSLVRLMLYANEFDIEGLIATASGTPGELRKAITRPDLIRQIVEAYGKVRKSLLLHDPGYPSVDHILARLRSGNPHRGLNNIGKNHDTDGSRWIMSVVDRADSRPVHVAIWGGQTDLAQALWRVREDRSPSEVSKFVSRLIVHDIADQDGLASWIREHFPRLFYILSKAPKGRDKREATFRGMYLGGDVSLTSRRWMDENIRKGHGPLGALYPPRTWTAPNPHSAIKEGDTPSWFFFLPRGLAAPRHPSWGSWGGRFEAGESHRNFFRDARDRVGKVLHARAAVWRWRPAFQNDFAARLDWCVQSRKKANHPPRAIVDGDDGWSPIRRTVQSGESIQLSTRGTRDPDGDSLQFRWTVYREAGTFRGEPTADGSSRSDLEWIAPRVRKPAEIHWILEVRDSGRPALSSFRRVVIEVRP